MMNIWKDLNFGFLPKTTTGKRKMSQINQSLHGGKWKRKGKEFYIFIKCKCELWFFFLDK